MTEVVHLERFVGLFFAGLGLLLLGGLNLLLLRRRAWVRVAASAAVGAAVVGGFAAWNAQADGVGRVAAILAVGLVPAVLLGSRRLADGAAAVAGFARRPVARWGLVAVGGLGLIVAGSVQFTRTDESVHDGQMNELELLTKRPDLSNIANSPTRTDRGYPVQLQRVHLLRDQPTIDKPEELVLTKLGYKDVVIRREPAADHSNCHGWVFTGGKYWVTGDAVAHILTDNGYAAVAAPRPGDLAIYRTDNGDIGHTAVVRYVADGMPPIVEGKWAWMGVFLHPVDKSAYGTNVTYYRSPRAGHVVAGVNGPADVTE